MTIKLAPIEFEHLNYSVYTDKPSRPEAFEGRLFEKQSDAENYAMDCAHFDRGHYYSVVHLPTRKVRFCAKLIVETGK